MWRRLQARWRLLREQMRRWRHQISSRLGRSEAAPKPSESAASSGSGSSGATVFTVADHHLVFGINWIPAQPTQLRALREQARKSGMRSHVAQGSLIGVTNVPAKSKQHPRLVAGALALSEGASLGGNEIFVLDLGADLFALVALQDSQPVPGFDLVGNQETIKAAADNFLRLPHRTVVRRCGSRDIIPDAEFFNFQSILEESDYAEARLKALTDYAKLIRQAMILIAVAGLVIGVYVYINQLRQAEEEARLQRENDPDVVYEKSFSQAQAKVPPLGENTLKLMLETAQNIPLSVGGWILMQVKCTTEVCTAQWSRQYGSYNDFSAALPADVKKMPNFSFLSKADMATTLVTEHPVAQAVDGKRLDKMRSGLPLADQAQIDFVSQMQDYSLVKLNGSVAAPALFGGNGPIGGIFHPVLSGEWTASGDLWQLTELKVPAYALVESFQINQLDQVGKRTSPTFSLSGRYFVKGKDFK
jgi:Pilin accessory protein (PilO)